MEILVGVGILGCIGVAFMTFMHTAYRGTQVLDEQTQAEALARSQLEDIKNSAFQDSGVYPVTVDLPPQYSMVIDVGVPTCVREVVGANCTTLETTTLQEITVSIFLAAGEGERAVLSVACYKVKK